ncbi:hypothetical protein [Dinoroseobacter sp. S76]|uniref:hypothetical protein n=1 Tax=Dinoroseobacter sp. S76 TaxID=3415124 RepID=UPI003C7A49E3
MTLIVAIILFGLYVGNVVLGATTGAPILNDVQEMVLLFAAAIAFTAAILQREAADKDRQDKNP